MVWSRTQPTAEPTDFFEYAPQPTLEIPGVFVALCFLAAFGALALWLWRWSVAQAAAENLGVDSGTTAVMMLTNPEDTMASLVSASAATDRILANTGDLASRLEHLEEARAKGLVTEDEYRAVRARILAEG